jgi:thermostable 8-oxoguanine DNA glycosylase
MTLTRVEFLRRFEQHILPKRFVKIRHYGFLQNHGKRARLQVIRKSLNLCELPAAIKIPVSIRMLEKYGKDIYKCPCCEKGRLVVISSVRFYKSNTQEMLAIQTVLKRNKASPENLEQQK